MKPYILVVEDEMPLITLLRYNLEEAGFEVEEATDGEEALISVMECKPDLVILDWMLPMISGIEVCRQLRRRRETRELPVIMLTARTEEGDRIRGLDSGADDYVTKPFSPKELIARIRAVMRRTRPSISAEKMTFADIEMDMIAHRVTRSGEVAHLGPTEFRLLRHFMEHPGRVFSREQLLDSVWGHNVYVEPRTVDVHIRRLRKALNVGKSPDVIRTVRSAGYAMELQPSSHKTGRGLAAQSREITQ
ncbi:MAG: phosphate regulon transcriptional regulator PhoB [Rhodospirillaceae bacterium]|nr:phosphate regulon transcriptional regulator PhoB [Rhodospirillaceae bacterium]MCY4311553.1 phosphate regulon transcriptional regulator PhoB [Rhodospirillaceae bacterium]